MDAVDEECLCRRTPIGRHWVKLAGRAEPSSLARTHVRETLKDRTSRERVDDAVLVASELVGNAVRHTADGPDCMVVEVHRDVAVLRVHDAGRDVSSVRAQSAQVSPDDPTDNGLGLLLVEELASGWSVRQTAIGKEVVVVLPLNVGGLLEQDVLSHIPTVRPPLPAKVHQLEQDQTEFGGGKSPED